MTVIKHFNRGIAQSISKRWLAEVLFMKQQYSEDRKTEYNIENNDSLDKFSVSSIHSSNHCFITEIAKEYLSRPRA